MWWDDLLIKFFTPAVSRFLLPFACLALVGAVIHWLIHFYS